MKSQPEGMVMISFEAYESVFFKEAGHSLLYLKDLLQPFITPIKSHFGVINVPLPVSSTQIAEYSVTGIRILVGRDVLDRSVKRY